MSQCKVTLLHNSPLWIAAHGARTCWNSHDKSDTDLVEGMPIICGTDDMDLIDRVGNKFKHASILEHLVYTFYITDFSRAVLQELSRHRMASPSVKSTRYTLKELKTEDPFTTFGLDYLKGAKARATKYLVLTGEPNVDATTIVQLELLRRLVAAGISNDKVKYAMPEAYKVSDQLTINARSLQNFLSLRTDKSALWEIREVAYALYEALPGDHKYLFTDKVKLDVSE